MIDSIQPQPPHPSSDPTNDIYSQKLSEFHDLCYDTSATAPKSSKLLKDYLLNPKIIGITFFVFYVQSMIITYFFLNEKYSKCPHTQKIKVGQFLLSSFYLTLFTFMYLFVFYMILKKFVF